MKRLCAFFVVSVVVVGLFGQVNADSMHCAKVLNQPVLKVCREKRQYYAIAANDSSSVYLVEGQRFGKIIDGKVINPSLEFGSLLVTTKGYLLLTTSNDYVYGWRKGKLVRFDFDKGLTDSLVVGFEGKDAYGREIVRTSRRTFVFQEGRSLEKSRFKYVKLTALYNAAPKISNKMKHSIQLPLNKAICFLFSDIDYSFKRHKAIRSKDVKEIEKLLLPGDILVKRNDYQVSNISIPGFFSHSGIYLGDFGIIDAYFKDLPMLKGLKPSEYIKSYNYGVYHRLSNKRNMIIEAIGEGVCINPLEHIAKVDYFAAMRPQISREDVFKSLLLAFDYLDFPYDYLFDFTTDDELVCSELVYKAFSRGENKNGICFRMQDRNGNEFLFPNDIGLQCSEEVDMPLKNLAFVVFCGVGDKGKRAEFKDISKFSETVHKQFVYEK